MVKVCVVSERLNSLKENPLGVSTKQDTFKTLVLYFAVFILRCCCTTAAVGTQKKHDMGWMNLRLNLVKLLF